MSDDPSPSSAAPIEDAQDDATENGNGNGNGNGDTGLGRPAGRRRSGSRTRRRRKKKKSKKKNNPGLMKKLSFITHLLRTLDVVVFAELSSLYYMEYVHLDVAPRRY